jgi:hypothetical protein
MTLTVSATSGGSFIQVPPGSHLARCYRIIDLGTQETTYQGQLTRSPRVLFQFEIHSEDNNGKPLLTPDGKPLSASKNFTLSFNERSSLRKSLQVWRNKEFTSEELKLFNLEDVLGDWALLTIVHSESKGTVYANIENINPVPTTVRKAGLPEPVNKTSIFSIRNADMALFETFTNGIKAKIEASPEWQEWKNAPKSKNEIQEPSRDLDDLESDIPF